MRVAIITSSDSGAAGLREDKSGPLIQEIVTNLGAEVVSYVMLPDEKEALKEEMCRIADNQLAELILTTGGTGFSKRDIMPEATLEVVERQVPGIPEAMRAYSMQFTARAMLSRAAAGIRDNTLIVNMPGSPKAIGETLEYIYPQLVHGIDILTGSASNCARKGPYVFCVCGVKNSGKTTYMEKLVAGLKVKGFRVATIKHDGHDFDGDERGTDSSRMYDAGADATAVFSASHVLIHKREEKSLDDIVKNFENYDFVLIEGCKDKGYTKVEILREGNSAECVSNPNGRIGLVTDIADVRAIKDQKNETIYDLNDVSELVSELISRRG